MNDRIGIKFLKIVAALTLVIIAAILYYNFNPELSRFFPPCIFKSLTGYKCPGCGSQRTIHYLLHFDIVSAFYKNPLLVVSLPYIVIGLLFEYTPLKERYPKMPRVLFGRVAIRIAFVLVVTYWITRNVFDF